MPVNTIAKPAKVLKPVVPQSVKFSPSKYQEAIFSWVQNAKKGSSLLVSAVPGSGKTTTLVELSKLIPSGSDSLFVAFNKSIATELGKRISFPCKTIHSLGFSALGRILPQMKVDGNKYRDILQSLFEDQNEVHEIFPELVRYLDLSMLTLSDPLNPSQAEAVYSHYGFSDPDVLRHRIKIAQAIELGATVAKEKGIISFSDMIVLPVTWKLELDKVDYLLCDESQDVNNAQLELLKRCLSPKSVAIFVGDRNQSIYGFAGAKHDSMDVIKESLKAEELPLSICYRCPESHIRLAGGIYPGIKGRESNPEGILEDIKLQGLYSKVKEGDMVLSRVTAPLIEICFKLIAEKKKAKLVGRDVSGQLVTLLRRVKKMAKNNYGNFHEALAKVEEQSAKRMKKESSIQALGDKVESLSICYEQWTDVRDFSGLEREIDSLFTDDARNAITLCTIHRAKGLETDNVFVLQKKLPLSYPKQQDWEKIQEANLQYVAYTRAKKALYLVDNVDSK